MNVLLVSSFVLPHAGGVEQFVETAKEGIRARGWTVRVLACRLPNTETEADATLPTLFLPPAGWPLPIGGLRTLFREVGRADVVVVNGSRHLLPIVATFAARLRGKQVLFVLHGSGAPFSTGSLFYHRLLGSVFERTLTRPALRRSRPVSVSRAGIAGARERYGVEAAYIPYPVRDLPPARCDRSLQPDEPIEVVWVGRLYPEKDPLRAVAVVDRLRQAREATLEIYGDGVLAGELKRLTRARPWLSVRGQRPWQEIQDVQSRAHVCLSTSVRDNVQVALLEALSRGIPVVSTTVGDARAYYVDPGLEPFCVRPRDVEAMAGAILELAASFGRYGEAFAANGELLRVRHQDGVRRLMQLIESANGAAAPAGSSAAAAPTHQRAR